MLFTKTMLLFHHLDMSKPRMQPSSSNHLGSNIEWSQTGKYSLQHFSGQLSSAVS